MRAAIDALLLAVIRAALHALTPAGRVAAMLAASGAVDWDDWRAQQGAEKTAPALEGRGV